MTQPKLEVILSPAEFGALQQRDLSQAVCVVFDVLRATTSMITALANGAAWQDKELLGQEATLVGTFKGAGMTVIEPDLALWRKPVLDKVPAQFAAKWGKGTFDALLAL